MTAIFYFDNEDCRKPMFMGQLNGPRQLSKITQAVPAGKKLVNTYRVNHGIDWFYLTTLFTPKTGHSYEVKVKNSNDNVSVYIFNKTDGSLKVEDTVSEPKRVCTW